MRFMVILTHVEGTWEQAAPGEPERVYQQYMALEQELKTQGKLVQSVRLRPSHEAKSMHNLPHGKRTIVSGPHSDSKEVIGGFYILECRSLDEACEWAERMPNYGHGSIEVRPVWGDGQ